MSARKNKTFKNITLVATIFGMVLLGVYWPGFDAYEQPPLNASVWALQTGEGKKFARVNTELAELDTVKDATNPTAIFQHGDSTYLFANGNQNFTEINPATPQDLVGDAGNLFKASPPDTIDVKQDGEWIAYLSSKGAVYAGNLGEEPKKLELENAFEANAFALNTNGLVALYSHSESRVVVFDLNNKSVKSDSFLEPKPESNTLEEKVQVTLVADKWLLLNEATKTLIFEGENEKTVLETAQKPLLQRSAQNGSGVFIADELGLLKFDIKTQTITREVLLDNTSEPARPFSLDGTAYAAWVSESNGKLWSSKNSDLKTLDFNGLTLEQDKRLTFQTNGTRAILNEQRSGWVWNIPNGELIRSSQYWNFDDKPPVIIEQAQQQEVKAPKPPVAEADFFGVRAGRSVMLPVLLNDHDPNEDILVIAEDSVSGLNPDFGRVSLSNNAQLLVADISPSAQGSATFTYQISDGTSKDGLLSEPTTVTLNVVAENQNEAPRWCGVESCLSQWPRLKVQAGRSASVEVLDAWVDPDGDPLYVSEYNKETESGRVIVTSEGKVTFQHNDPTTAEQQSLSVPIEVFDTRGLSQNKTLNIDILPQPELTVAPFTVVGIPGQKINVDIAEHVSGASGEVRLRAANLTDDRLGVVSTQTESSVVGFLSQESGSYNLQVLVADEVSETTAQVRVELFDPQQAEITTTPLTAFIRPNEDVTVDVFDGIFDPADSVLMIEEIEIQPEANSILEAQIVGQKHVRATGVTEDGMTGVLGHAKYSVSDGSDLPGRSATGEITFILLPQGDAAAPIAVDDSVTVNTGTQIDIPVLENDIAPTGTQIQVDPASIVNEHEAGLAFANSRQIRYLAPEKPGEYTVAYSIFRLGHPSQTDTAKVRITVVDDDTDLQFEAPDLEGRVYSGSSVSIPLSATASPFIAGQLNITRIIDQPSKGSASVNSEADKIVYVSESDFSGQVSFRYEASDERGNLISGNVKVGVLDAEADPRPVTYSDYFQAQVGEKNAVSVFPLANDIDPTNTGLSLLSVVPNEPKDSNEYLTLQNKIDSLDLESGLVKIKAGEDLGTFSYVYTAENGFGDTAKGLIIIKVVREPVLGYPQVQDTKLTSETLDTLHSGVDVITDKIVWHSGDPDTLEVVLWGQSDNFETAGKLIKGLPAEKNQIVPFSVGGESYSGEEVVSYGFLRVPSSVANIVSLRSSFTELSVDERGTLEIDMADAVHIPDGESLEVLNSGVRSTGIRPQGVCSHVSGTKIRYEAGAGSPWHDNCVVPVKLKSQEWYTHLNIKIKIVAADPQPELRHANLTISPGDSQNFNLDQMIVWPGGKNQSAPQLASSYEGNQFIVSSNKNRLTITAKDDARQGREETVTVSFLDRSNEKPSLLRLTVGPSPKTLPKGGTVTAVCSQSAGVNSCLIPVTGVKGEVNPLPGTPLTLKSVSNSQTCNDVKFAVQDNSTVRATWSSDASGVADCRSSFVVSDAQGRLSTGERQGNIILDLRGLPADPQRLEWVRYGKSSVNLFAASGGPSHPQITGYVIKSDTGESYSCSATGDCVIEGLAVGEQTSFTAYAVNEVGQSRNGVSITAWAYRSPDAPIDGFFEPLPSSDGAGNYVRLSINGIDPSTAKLVVTTVGGGRTTSFEVHNAAEVFEFNVGSNFPTDLEVTPETVYRVPPSSVAGGAETKKLIIRGAHGIGKPVISATHTTSFDPVGVSISGMIEKNGTQNVKIGFAEGTVACVPSNDLTGNQFEHFFEIAIDTPATLKVCAEHYLNDKKFGVSNWSQTVSVQIPEPTGDTYTVGSNAVTLEDGKTSWGPITHSVNVQDGFVLMFTTPQGSSQDFSALFTPGEDPRPITAMACLVSDLNACSGAVSLNPTGPAYAPTVWFNDTADANGFCLAELATTVETVDPEGILLIEEETDGIETWLKVFDKNGRLEPVTSPRCVNSNI